MDLDAEKQERPERESGGLGPRPVWGLQLVALLLQISAIGSVPVPAECVLSNGMNYRGEQQVTSAGEPCVNWMECERDYNLTLYPDSVTGVGDHRFCRNPDGEDGPWCYVKALGEERPVRHTCGNGGCNGQALTIGMMVIIIVLGAGITVGYIYKWGRDLKKEQDQRACEREMHRIMLPLSAFSNPSCELVDEITVVVENPETQTGECSEGANPLMGTAGTPGA